MFLPNQIREEVRARFPFAIGYQIINLAQEISVGPECDDSAARLLDALYERPRALRTGLVVGILLLGHEYRSLVCRRL